MYLNTITQIIYNTGNNIHCSDEIKYLIHTYFIKHLNIYNMREKIFYPGR